MKTEPERVYTVEEFAKQIGMSRSFVRKLCQRVGSGVTKVKSRWQIPQSAVDRFLEWATPVQQLKKH